MTREAPISSRPVSLTEARVRLFRLVEDLLAGRTDRVALSHRGHDEEVLLVRARDMARLEAELATLRGRSAPAPRPLRGIARIIGSVDDVLTAVRADQRALADAKLAAIAGAAPVAPTRRGAAPQKAPVPNGAPRRRST